RAMLATGAGTLAQVDREKISQWVDQLSSPESREKALLELSKKMEPVPDQAPMSWPSCGPIAALLWGWVLQILVGDPAAGDAAF
uniref:Uncharacterized protein n=1 Tax=Echeneis naucrates TaxID=173247 RepID=A0A665T376_ECHNA